MENVTTIGLDLAKSVFRFTGLMVMGKTVVVRRLTRSKLLPFFAKLPACVVGMEACSSSPYWARELVSLGHEVRQQILDPCLSRRKTTVSAEERKLPN